MRKQKKESNQSDTVQKPRSRHGWLKWFFGNMLVLGAILFFAPMIYEHQQDNQRMHLAETYRKHLYPADAKRDELIRQYNANAYATQQHRALPYKKVTISDIMNGHPKAAIGNVTIPSIHLKGMPVYYGDSDKILAKGTGVMPFTSLPSPGKYVTSSVTGHTGMANRIFFDNIRYMKKGDVFYLDVFAHRLAYQVYAKKVIDPLKADAISHFYVKSKQNRAILMTCTPIGINDHRLLVYGKRIPLKQAEQKHTIPRDTFSPMNIWRDSIILLLILLLIWWLYRWYQDHRDKKKREEEERQAAEAAKAAAEAQPTDEGTK